MRRIDEIHLNRPTAGSRMLRDLLQREGFAVGRKHVASGRGGEVAATMYSLVATCKMNNVDPFAYLTDVLGRIRSHRVDRLAELLPFNWTPLGA